MADNAENGSGSSPSRFYAAIDAGRMECPVCTRMLLWGLPARRTRDSPDGGHWDPLVSVIRCPGCGTQYQLGIIAWPFRSGKRGQVRQARTIPGDQRADLRQAVELRQLAGGFWPKGISPRSRVNVYNPVGCTCWGKKVDPACVIHGEPGPLPVTDQGGESEPE